MSTERGIEFEEQISERLAAVVSSTGLSVVGRCFAMALGLGVQIAVGSLLGPEAFGKYAIIIGMIVLAGTASRLGLSRGIIKYADSTDRQRSAPIFLTSIAISLVTGSAIAVSMIVFSAKIGRLFNFDVVTLLYISVWSIPFVAASGVIANGLRAFNSARDYIIIDLILKPSLVFVFPVSLIALNTGIVGALGGYAVAQIVIFLVAFSFVPRSRDDSLFVSASRASDLLRFSIPVLGSTLSTFLLLWIDKFILGALRSASEAGIYQASFKLASVLVIPSFALGLLIEPLFATLEEDVDQIRDLYPVFSRWLFISTITGFVLLIGFRNTLLSLFGREFIQGGVALMLIATAHVVHSLAGPAAHSLNMAVSSRLDLINTGIAVIANVVLNILLIPQFGYVGAAVATASSMALMEALRLLEIYQYLGINPFSKDHLRASIIPVLTAGLITALEIADLPQLIALLGATVGAGILFILGLSRVTIDERDNIIKDTLLRLIT
ncbi:flippase [Haloprofundus sp. MHR1]|uniref:flippase n=1 Tax=Haloprofundus sp. MHR1 TaxID=2572921 RepID=UPI0010BE915F|nr:flippase [Haloprofundus sp. MHR1]QCJ45906.1 flippase [Haloprofundus sp. MHR1]